MVFAKSILGCLTLLIFVLSGCTTDPKPREAKGPPKIALVLGGGAARGLAHVGVIRVLEQEKIPISMIVGTSVGSLIGALYAADPNSLNLEWLAFSIEKEDILTIPWSTPRWGRSWATVWRSSSRPRPK